MLGCTSLSIIKVLQVNSLLTIAWLEYWALEPLVIEHLLHLLSHVVRCSILLLVGIELSSRHTLTVLLVL